LRAAGMEVEFISNLFSWLVVPVLLFRVLPSMLKPGKAGGESHAETAQADHSLPTALVPCVTRVHSWEVSRMCRGVPVPIGSSLACVAKALPRK
jgi:hypothetical protein